MNRIIYLSRYITSSLEDILQNLVQTIKKQKLGISDTEAEEIVKHLWNIIPQGNKHVLTPWLVKIWLNNNGYIDEERAKLLINTIYEAKTTFPNNFPKDFNINNYRDLDELESFLDPWIIKLSNIQEKHEEIEKSRELGKIVFQKGEYKVLRIDKPEDIVEFLRINNIDSWCIKNLDYAKHYGTTWFLIKGNSIIGAYAEGEKELRDRNNRSMQDTEAVRTFAEFLRKERKTVQSKKLLIRIPMTKEEIDTYIDKGDFLDYLYQYQKLSPEQIDKAIDKGEDLAWLYMNTNLTFTPENIDKAIDKGIELCYLYWYHKLTTEQIDKAIERGKDLFALYQQQSLTYKQIDKAIDIGKYLMHLYTYQKLTPKQIDKAIEKGEYLNYLYENQKLTPSQIDKAIDKGKYLRTLYECQTLTPEQKKKIEEKLGIKKSIKLSKYIINR